MISAPTLPAARHPRLVATHFMFAVLSVVSVFAFVQGASAQGRPAGVVVETIETRSFTETAPILGEFVAPTNSVVASRIPGLIVDISVQIGDRVTEGDLLVRLDTELLDIELRAAMASRTEAEAGLTVAEADLALAKQAFERIERLKASPAFSQGQFNDLGRQFQRAQGQIAQANARIQSAEVAIARSQYNLENAEIRAPFSGTVVERQAQLGEYINTGNAVVTLLDQANLEIVADVPYSYVGGLSNGREISVRLSSGTEYMASIRALLPRETVSTRTRPVRLAAPFTKDNAVDGATPFAVGQSVTIQVPVSEERNVLTVPKDALVQGRGGWIVYIAEDGKAQPRPVQIGAAVGGRFEVLGGLEEGMQVVVRGNERLRPGQDIMTGPPGGEQKAPVAAGEGAPAGGPPKEAAKATETDGKPDSSKNGG